MSGRMLGLAIMILSLVPQAALAADAATTERLLREIDQQPTAITIDPAAFAEKQREREIILRASGLTADEASREKLENLVSAKDLIYFNGRYLRTPQEIDARGLNRFTLQQQPWSGSAWLMYKGLTAQRYIFPEARGVQSWLDAWKYVASPGHSFFEVISGASSDTTLDDLSPAEKYDLLFSQNPNGVLAAHEWSAGRAEQARSGDVLKWWGYCHGWAAASVSIARPLNAVDIPTMNGDRYLRFYPSDIKALTTALWANAMPPTRMLGVKCQIANPPMDSNGRVTDEDCFDVNPGTFHLALVHQLAGSHRGLIMDASYDIEVWNQPIVSYSYTYFNPQTRASLPFAQSVIPLSQYTNDKYGKYRARQTRSVVGVSMDVTYVTETDPDHQLTDDPSRDATRLATYLYDLELDDQGRIIGGEWYQVHHPDFVWANAPGARAAGPGDVGLTGTWNDPDGLLMTPMPVSWRAGAINGAAKGQPLAAALEAMIRASRIPNPGRH